MRNIYSSYILIDNIKLKKPFLKTTTSKLIEYMKAFELKIIKELGKLTPKLRDKEYQSLYL
jgi:hypothetical protein